MVALASLMSDVRHGFRALTRDKGFTVVALLIFALCFGANVALFAIVNAVLLRPLPFPQAEQLVVVYNAYPKAGVPRAGCSVPHYLERREGVAAFSATAAVRDGDRTLGESGSPERVATMAVTPSFFQVLGIAPALGRAFTEDEATPGNENVIILSHGLWRERYGGDPDIIGRKVRIDGGTLATVVGVMPPGFQYLSSKARLWTPLVFTDDNRKPEQRHSNNMSMIARLRPGATVALAQTQVDALNRAAAEHDPFGKLVADAGFFTRVANLHDDYVAETRPIVLMLQAAVLVLMLIGLVNLTNLLLVRATGRTKELSVRQVLGASSVQLGRQIIAETVVLAVVGGVLGLATGWAGLRALTLLGWDQLPRTGDVTIDATVAAVAMLGAVAIGVLLAAPVAWQIGHRNLAAALSVESRGGTTSRATHRLRHALITAQIALAFVLLVSAGLLGLSFARVTAVKPGFQAEDVVTASIPLPRSRYPDKKPRVALSERLVHELASLPGTTAVGVGNILPFTDHPDENAISIDDQEPKPGESLRAHYVGGVTGDYFAALGIPLREGRFLTSDDTARDTPVCVVDEIVARYYWPNGGAIGHRIRNGVKNDKEPPYTIVGVVGAVKQNDLADQRAMGAVYLPFGFYTSRTITVAVRTSHPAATGPLVREALRRIDPDLPVTDLKLMSARIDDSLEQRRSPLFLAALFAALALVLVTIGLYGVLAYAVTQRRREIGVRMALGAQPADIRTQFLGLGARLALIGGVIGGIGAWGCGRAMHTLLFGVSPQQPVVFGATMAILAGVALAACFLPAARAARVAPMEALRGE